MAVEIDLSGKVALVTGSSQGIDAEIARALHRAGAVVVINHPDLGDGQPRRRRGFGLGPERRPFRETSDGPRGRRP